MRYCTKEIYETMQKTHFHRLLRINNKAEIFEEDFYRKLYAKKLDERLALDKGCSEVKGNKIIFEWEFENKEDFERALREYKPPVFDPEHTKQEFAAQHKRTGKDAARVTSQGYIKQNGGHQSACSGYSFRGGQTAYHGVL